MGKTFWAIVIFLSVFGNVGRSWGGTDFHAIYKVNEAEKQLAAEDYQEAYSAFAKVASNTNDQDMAALADARAAVALGLQADKYKDGLERARSVADRPYSVQAQMQLMIAQEDFRKLVDTFRDEDIADWPRRTLPQQRRVGQRDVRAVAFFDRGRAFLQIGEGKAAARDIDRACEFADAKFHKLRILSFLVGDVYAGALEDADKAFETNMRIVELDAGYAATMRATLSAARYLRDKERYDEALAVLAHSNWRKKRSPYWFTRGMNTIAKTLAAAGRYSEAADAYRRIMEADDKRTKKADRNRAALQLGRMLREAGETAAARRLYKDLVERKDIDDEHRKQAEAALSDLD